VFIGGAVGGANGIGERGGRSTFAGNFGGDALVDFRRKVRIDEDGFFRLPQHVDKARSDHHAGGIDGLFGGE
jgi:hypothetical protein